MLIYIVLIDESQYNVYKIENENNAQNDSLNSLYYDSKALSGSISKMIANR